MFNSSYAPTLSDIAAVSGRNNDGFGDGNGWWILVILFALFGGWGGNRGYGNDGGSNGYSTEFVNLERKIDGVNNGLCDGFYAQNTNLLNGFATTNAAISNGFAGVNNAVCTLGYQNAQLINGVEVNAMQNTNALQAQISDCCCQNHEAIAQLRYDMAMNNCSTNTAIANAVRDIMQNDNNNYRALHDEHVAEIIEAKNNQIADLRARLDRCQLNESQNAQTAYLESLIRSSKSCCNDCCA